MKLLEHIPKLMNCICLIHNVSQYYNTSERMTSLFIKITNQMISTCKAHLCQGVSKVWEHSRYTIHTHGHLADITCMLSALCLCPMWIIMNFSTH